MKDFLYGCAALAGIAFTGAKLFQMGKKSGHKHAFKNASLEHLEALVAARKASASQSK